MTDYVMHMPVTIKDLEPLEWKCTYEHILFLIIFGLHHPSILLLKSHVKHANNISRVMPWYFQIRISRFGFECLYLDVHLDLTVLTQPFRIFETPVHRDPKWSDIKYLPDLSDQHYDIDKEAYHHSSSYCIRFSWAGNEENLIFLIWKFFPDLLKS